MNPSAEGRRPHRGTPIVAAAIGEQLVGFPLPAVRDVFTVGALTRVPLAPPFVAGLVNLRGRVLTALDLRVRFGLRPHVANGSRVAMEVEIATESYAVIVDRVIEVLWLDPAERRAPSAVDDTWDGMANGFYAVADGLLAIVNLEALLDGGRPAAVA